MAEGLVTDLIKQLVSVAALESEQEIRLVVGVDEEVEKLKGNLQTVTAVLNDAEKRQVTEETVKLWLEKLKDACYKMNDVIDEWNTAMIKSTIKKEEENVDNAHPVMKKKVPFHLCYNLWDCSLFSSLLETWENLVKKKSFKLLYSVLGERMRIFLKKQQRSWIIQKTFSSTQNLAF